jgi:hypothetical protein
MRKLYITATEVVSTSSGEPFCRSASRATVIETIAAVAAATNCMKDMRHHEEYLPKSGRGTHDEQAEQEDGITCDQL